MTSKKKEIKFSFALKNIEKLKFFENDPEEISFSLEGSNQINTAINTELEFHPDEQSIAITLEVNLKTIKDSNDSLFGIKTRHTYKISNFSEIIKGDENNGLTIPDFLLTTLISIAYSDTRGMLVILTTNEKYKKLFLPIVNPAKLLPRNNPDC